MNQYETAMKYLSLIHDGILIPYSMTEREKKRLQTAIHALEKCNRQVQGK